MTKNYFGEMDGNFNPLDNYPNYTIPKDWDFESREAMDNDSFPSITNPIFIELIKKHK